MMEMSSELSELKAKIFALLREDEEFRYAVAGMLGLDEILRRLEKHDERFEEILRRLDRHEAELIKLREDFNKLREDFNKIREDFNKLREDFNNLREDFNKMLEVIKHLQEGHARLERRITSLESAMISGFGEISKFAGLTFEEFVRKFLSASLRKSGEIPGDAELTRSLIYGEEINLFLEDPLIVGEVTVYAESPDEIIKLLRKIELAKAKYSKEPRKFLVILTAKSDAAREIRRIAEEKGIELIIGKLVD
jgi:predicted nuclease with TOPRIM domain